MSSIFSRAFARLLFFLSIFLLLVILFNISLFEQNVCAEAIEPREETIKRPVNIVITATRTEAPVSSLGSSITMIDAKQIRDSKAKSLADILRTAPGLEVIQSGGRGGVTSIFIRGGDSDHTLVLIDGIRANDNNTGQFDFADFQAENIERIEIVRGQQSVLYGSEAIGGVINIITKKTVTGTTVRSTTEGGSYGTRSEEVGFDYRNEFISSANSLSYFKTDGLSAASTNRGNPENDSYENISFSSHEGITFLDDGKADLSLRYQKGKAELDGFTFGTGPTDALNFVQDRELINGAVTIQKKIGRIFTPSVELGINNEDLVGSDPDDIFNTYDVESRSLRITQKNDLEIATDQLSTVGYSLEQRTANNKGAFDKDSQVNSIFAQQQLKLVETVDITLGGRYDKHSEFGEAATYRLTFSKQITQTLSRIHSSIGSGFKAPSFNELYFPDFGNINLEEERSWGFDTGIEQKLFSDKVLADITFFKNDFDNLIGFDSENFIASNIKEAKAYGIEASLDMLLLTGTQVSLNYTLTESEDLSSGKPLPRRPRHRGSINLTFDTVENVSGNLRWLLVNNRIDSDGTKMDDYNKFDLAFSYNGLKSVTPFFRFDNIFDEDYEEISGFSSMGFAVYAGIEAKI